MPFDKLVPTWYSHSVFDIDKDFVEKNNIKTILCDLDNTISPYYATIPDQKVIDFVHNVQQWGVDIYITSNNNQDRVKKYCEPIGIKYLYHAKKPFRSKIRKFMIDNNIDFSTCIIIGDQLLTDTLFSKRFHVRCLLVDPIVEHDLLVTRFNRYIDKKLRKRYIRKKLFKGIHD